MFHLLHLTIPVNSLYIELHQMRGIDYAENFYLSFNMCSEMTDSA